MIPRFRTLGISLGLMVVLTGVLASASPAVPITVSEGGLGATYYTASLDGEQHEFVTSNGSVRCNSVSFSGSSFGASVDELTLAPSYGGCISFGFATTDVKTNGCTYTFTTPWEPETGQATWFSVNIHLVCPAGKSIEVTPTTFGSSVCTQFIPEQTPTSGHVVGKNTAGSSPMDVTMEFTLSSIHYTGTGGVCGNAETHANGWYFGNSTLRAYSNFSHTTQRSITVA